MTMFQLLEDPVHGIGHRGHRPGTGMPLGHLPAVVPPAARRADPGEFVAGGARG